MHRSHLPGCLALLLLLLCHYAAWGYPCRPFDPQYLLKTATVVAKVQVLSTKVDGTCKDPRFDSTISRTVAHVKLLATIKGTPAGEFDITYPYPAKDVTCITAVYPSLLNGEITLVFLTGDASPYAFVDLDNDKMAVVPDILPFTPQQSPEERLQAEITAAVKIGKDRNQLEAIERLGQMGNPDAVALLRPLSTSADVAVAGTAMIAQIRVKDPPDTGTLLAFLKRNTADFNERASITRYGTTGYSLGHLQNGVIKAICDSVRLDSRRKDAQVEMIPGFPYLEFFQQVLPLEIVKKGGYPCIAIGSALRDLANPASIPLLCTLIDHPNRDLRYFAVTALAKLFNRNDLFPATSLFENDEEKYRSYWREWWKTHQASYEKKG